MRKKFFASLLLAGLLFFAALPLRAIEVPLDTKQSFFKFTGHTFTHDFNGEAKTFNGTAQVDPQSPQIVTAAKINIQSASLTTLQAARDRNMLEWLRAGDNPAITFELSSVKATKGEPAQATKDKPAEFTVGGNFTLNKATKPISATVTGWREGKWLVIVGKTKLDTTLFGLPILGQSITAVDKMVAVDFRLVFDLPPELQIAPAPSTGSKPAETTPPAADKSKAAP